MSIFGIPESMGWSQVNLALGSQGFQKLRR